MPFHGLLLAAALICTAQYECFTSCYFYCCGGD